MTSKVLSLWNTECAGDPATVCLNASMEVLFTWLSCACCILSFTLTSDLCTTKQLQCQNEPTFMKRIIGPGLWLWLRHQTTGFQWRNLQSSSLKAPFRWEARSIACCEPWILPQGQTANADFCCKRLRHPKKKIWHKQLKCLLLMDTVLRWNMIIH